jgi:hypothetical protein
LLKAGESTAMRPYHHLEVYQLARGLLAAVCAVVVPTDESDSHAGRLRHAALNAVLHIADGNPSPQRPAQAAQLVAARGALDEIDRLLAACLDEGSLTPAQAEALSCFERQVRDALERLSPQANGNGAAAGREASGRDRSGPCTG